MEDGHDHAEVGRGLAAEDVPAEGRPVEETLEQPEHRHGAWVRLQG